MYVCVCVCVCVCMCMCVFVPLVAVTLSSVGGAPAVQCHYYLVVCQYHPRRGRDPNHCLDFVDESSAH